MTRKELYPEVEAYFKENESEWNYLAYEMLQWAGDTEECWYPMEDLGSWFDGKTAYEIVDIVLSSKDYFHLTDLWYREEGGLLVSSPYEDYMKYLDFEDVCYIVDNDIHLQHARFLLDDTLAILKKFAEY